MTQDRHSGSTLAEQQIAWLRDALGDGIPNIAAHWDDNDDDMLRSILATLEGMAATSQAMTLEMVTAGIAALGSDDDRSCAELVCDVFNSMREAKGLGAPGDITGVARKLLANVRFVDDDEDPAPAIELIADALQSERTLAADKARREALREAEIACGPETWAGFRIRALTPQNPGDAALESEHG